MFLNVNLLLECEHSPSIHNTEREREINTREGNHICHQRLGAFLYWHYCSLLPGKWTKKNNCYSNSGLWLLGASCAVIANKRRVCVDITYPFFAHSLGLHMKRTWLHTWDLLMQNAGHSNRCVKFTSRTPPGSWRIAPGWWGGRGQ